MKSFAKLAFGALLLAGSATAIATPAAARVSIGFGFGIPGPVYGPSYYGPPPVYCDPRSRYYDPYRCDAYDGYYYNDPIWFDGAWVNGAPYRYYGGVPQFYIGGQWHSNVRYGSGGFHSGSVSHGGAGRTGGGGGGRTGGSAGRGGIGRR